MYCQKCGNDNRDGASFCVKCGAPLLAPETPETVETPEPEPVEAMASEAVAPESEQPQPEAEQPQPEQPAEPAEQSQKPEQPEAAQKEKKPLPKKLLIGIGIGAAVLTLAIGLCVLLFGKPTINLNNYLITEAEGYNGHGEVQIYVDWEAIEEDYGDRLEYTKEFQKENFVYNGFYEDYRAIDVVASDVYIDTEDYTGLSNGDKVAYTWDVYEGLEDIVDCKLKYSDGTYTVSGLEEIETFDAFADVEITFEGVAPNGTANLTYKGKELEPYDFYIDKSSGLSDGEVITVSLEGEPEEYADELGKIPAKMEKEYKVEGLGGFMAKLDQLSDADMESLQNKAESVYRESAEYWDEETETLNGMTYVGSYFLTNKEEDSWGYQNILYLVYQVEVRNKFTNDEGQTYDETHTIYWYLAFPDVVIDKDGKMSVDLDGYDRPWDDVEFESDIENGWGTETWYYEGYEDLDELYEEVVEEQAEDYNHEDNMQE